MCYGRALVCLTIIASYITYYYPFTHPHLTLATLLSFFSRHILTPAEQCSPPPEVKHGTVNPVRNYYTQGTTIYYSCEEGYSSQITERTCETGGEWSGPEPECLCKFVFCFITSFFVKVVLGGDRSYYVLNLCIIY